MKAGLLISALCLFVRICSAPIFGSMSGTDTKLHSGEIIYPSSIDSTRTNLEALYWYKNIYSDTPVVVVMHSLGSNSADTIWCGALVANYGFFVVAPNLGNAVHSGPVDYSGVELMDIYDAVAYVRAHFPVSQNYAAIFGWSGGGGNTLASACKFPDLYAVYADYFGMADYDTWHTWTDTDNYPARDAKSAIGTNLQGGQLFIFQNSGDVTVAPTNSYRITNSMTVGGKTNWTLKTSSTLYNHANFITLDDGWDWCQMIREKTIPAWTIPVSGTVKVLGYIITKRFKIWLGGGTNQVATVTYDTSAKTYTLVPITTNGINAVITQGSSSLSTNFSITTTVTLP